jgi:Arc/MetJ family transcription regulator
MRHWESHHLMLYSVPHYGPTAMRTTLALDDDLLADAQDLTGLREKSALVREALVALIQRESARRLARLGGSQPQMKPVARRRSD